MEDREIRRIARFGRKPEGEADLYNEGSWLRENLVNVVRNRPANGPVTAAWGEPLLTGRRWPRTWPSNPIIAPASNSW